MSGIDPRDHIGLAVHLANELIRPGAEHWREDLVQEAYLGLVEAAAHYDPARGPFAPYASRYIRGRLMAAARTLTCQVHVSRYRWLRGERPGAVYPIDDSGHRSGSPTPEEVVSVAHDDLLGWIVDGDVVE